MFDLIIIGGGPAACAAGVYAARKHLKTLIITKEFGGQSIVSPEIYNWIGTPAISGEALAKSLQNHVRAYSGEYLTIVEGEHVTSLAHHDSTCVASTSSGTTYEGLAVLIASGAQRRKLTVPGAATYEQKGLTYCATCDGPLFSGIDVAVIGGGNAGFESAAQLLAYAKSVTLLDNGPAFKADAITVEKVLSHPHARAHTHAETLEVVGETMVTGLRYKDTQTGEEHLLPVQGIFIEIGMVPNTTFAQGVVELNAYGKVVVDPRTQRTSRAGIWAAGDCTDGLFSQNNIAVGDAIKAVEDIYASLRAGMSHGA